MAAPQTPFSVTSDRQTLSLSAARPKDNVTVKIRNEGVAADNVNVGIEPGLGPWGQPNPQAAPVDPQWFTVEGSPLPVQRQIPPGTDVLVTVTVTVPDGQQAQGPRVYPFVPLVWSAIRPPRETTVYGPPTTLIVEPIQKRSWLRRFWWLLAIAGLGLVVGVVIGVVLATSDDPVNESPVPVLTVVPTTAFFGENIFVDATGSSDDSGTFDATVFWGDGSSEPIGVGGVMSAVHVYATTGAFDITLEVSDGESSASTSQTVVINPPIG